MSQFANNAESKVAVVPSPPSTGQSLEVEAGTTWPAPPFLATICPEGVQATQANSEIVQVTAVAGVKLSILRGVEGPMGLRTVIKGDRIFASVTASGLEAGKTVTKTGAYVLTPLDKVVLVDAASGAFNVTLPTAVGFTGVFTLRAITTGANVVTVKTISGQTIDLAPTITLGTAASGAAYLSASLVSDNANWRVV